MPGGRGKVVEELKASATHAAELCRRQARRPFILELAGTPKAGKTTSLGILKDFLKDQGFRVSVMRERAAECPIPMKGHFFFNAWTTTTMLAQVLAQLDTTADILLLDRGFFDALVWLELQHGLGQVTDEEKEIFERFVLLDRWQRLTDLTVVLKAKPAVAMHRENLGRIAKRQGSIMDPSFLRRYNRTLQNVARRHKDRFNVLTVDSSKSKDPVGSGIALLGRVLPHLLAWADPKIAALPVEAVRRVFADGSSITAKQCRIFLDDPRVGVVSRRRSRLDAKASTVQLVACAAFKYKGRYVVIERSPRDPKTARFGARTLWHRCRVQQTPGTPILEAAKLQLSARIRDDLHLSRLDELQLRGAVWSDADDERKYLGIMFIVEIDDEEIAASLSTKELRRGDRAPLLRTSLYDLGALSQAGLETWSKVAVSALLKP